MSIVPSGTSYHSKAKQYTDYSKTFSVQTPTMPTGNATIPTYSITNTLELPYTYYQPVPPASSPSGYDSVIQPSDKYGGTPENLKWPGYVHVRLPKGKWHIELNGGRGGDYGGYRAYGRGARILVYYDNDVDEDIVITAGGAGADISWYSADTSAGPGGGASFVYSMTRRQFIAVAAGGNGAADIWYLSRGGRNNYYGTNANGYSYLTDVTNTEFFIGMPIHNCTRYRTSYAPFGNAMIYDDVSSLGGAANMNRYAEGVSNATKTAAGTEYSSGKCAIPEPVAYLLSCGDNGAYTLYGDFNDQRGFVGIYPNTAGVDVMYKSLIEAYSIKEIFDYLLVYRPNFLIYMFYALPCDMKRDLSQRMTPQILGSINPPVSYTDFATIMGYRGTLIETLRYFRNTDTLSLFEVPEEVSAFRRMLGDVKNSLLGSA